MDIISILFIWVVVIFFISILWYIVYGYCIPPIETDNMEETIPTAIEIITTTVIEETE